MAEDKRLTEVRNEEYAALSDLEKTYGDRVAQADKYYDKLIENSEAWADKQAEIQNQQTEFTIEQIEQQREKAQKDYLKEQSAAYVDWQKQSNPYGVQAEQTASAGMRNTGYAETLQVSMYNTYQNRVATAREVIAQANLNFDNGIKEAKLQNSAILAEIHFKAYQEQLELGLQSFQAQNQLLSELTDKKLQTKSLYQDKWKAILNQINAENALAEEQRQFDLTLAEQQRQFDASQSGGSGSLGGGGSGGSGKILSVEEGRATVADAGKVGGGGRSFANANQNNKEAGKNGFSTVYKKTDYYDGYLPQFTVSNGETYGYFSNGYQPKGIKGHGKLTKTDNTFVNYTQTLDGKSIGVTQNIWKATDGTYWYWEGREMMYIQTSM